jgi:hypothetical protein
MSLGQTTIIFSATHILNEIELINHVHRIRAQAKALGITGIITYRAGLFATLVEGSADFMEQFSQYLNENYTLKYSNSSVIFSRKYTGVNLSFVGEDQAIVNEPLLDWGIEDKKLTLPQELIGKIFEINRQK